MAGVKKRPNRGEEFQAMVVAEAKAGTLAEAAKRHGVSIRSIQRWARKSKGDRRMAESVARKSSLIEQDWADTARAAMNELLGSLVATVKRAADEEGAVPDHRIHEMAGAVKIVGELGVAKEMFGRKAEPAPAATESVTDGRAAENDREDAAPGEGAPVLPIRGIRGVKQG